MPPSNTQALQQRHASGIDFVIDRNFLQNLDPDHEYTLTRTTTETIKLSKSPNKSMKTSKSSTDALPTKKTRRGSSSSREDSPRPNRAPRDISELFTRLINQIKDRSWDYYTKNSDKDAWSKLLNDVKYIQDHFDDEGLLDPRKAMELQSTLQAILKEAEEGRDVHFTSGSLRESGENVYLMEDKRVFRESYLRNWGVNVWIERRYLEQRKEQQEKEKEKQRLEKAMRDLQQTSKNEETKQGKQKKEKSAGYLGWLTS